MVLDSIVLLALLALIPSAPASPPSNADLAAQVRAAETAFARTMADRDHAAFMTHLADETVFFGREGAIRGKAAVAESWKGFFEGKDAPFSWAS
ncbi:MAG: hypothetical protein FD129_1841, partial [bacterium]